VQTAASPLTGALLLAWMGGSMIWNTWRGRVRLPRADENSALISNGRLVALGAAATISNPF
jgi:threonine/homoserine/homoserine lactone efflux protein